MSKTFTSRIIADGRVTLPKDIREKQALEDGDLVELLFVRKIKSNRDMVLPEEVKKR